MAATPTRAATTAKARATYTHVLSDGAGDDGLALVVTAGGALRADLVVAAAGEAALLSTASSEDDAAGDAAAAFLLPRAGLLEGRELAGAFFSDAGVFAAGEAAEPRADGAGLDDLRGGIEPIERPRDVPSRIVFDVSD